MSGEALRGFPWSSAAPNSRGAAAVGIALAAALAGCGGGGDGGPSAGGGREDTPERRAAGSQADALPPSDADAVRALLGRRAAALEARDAAAYAATATGAQRRRDRRVVARARPLRPRDIGVAVETLDLIGDRAEVAVRSSYRVQGVSGTFSAPRRIVAVRRAGGWRVRSETSPQARERHPGEVGRFVVTRSPHFVVQAPAGLGVGELTTALEAGYRRIRAALPDRRLRRRTLVVVAGDARQALALTGAIRGVGGLAAVSDAEVRESGPARRVIAVASQRLIVVWSRWAALPPVARERVVTHELTHAALAGTTSGRTPAWLVEGVALYISGDRRSDAVARLYRGQTAGLAPGQARAARRALSLGALARPDAIARRHGAGQAAAYAFSSAAAYAVAERYGRARLLRLHDAFSDEQIRGGPGRELSDRAVRRVLGTSLSGLERSVRARAGGG